MPLFMRSRPWHSGRSTRGPSRSGMSRSGARGGRSGRSSEKTVRGKARWSGFWEVQSNRHRGPYSLTGTVSVSAPPGGNPQGDCHCPSGAQPHPGTHCRGEYIPRPSPAPPGRIDRLACRLQYGGSTSRRTRARTGCSGAGGRLGVAQQQMIEIAKAMSHAPSVLMLDEPTSALAHREADRLFTLLKRLAAKGWSSSISRTGSKRSTGSPMRSRF